MRVLLLLGFVLVLFLFFRWLFRQPPRVYWQGIVILIALVVFVLVATGRAHWLAAVFAALLPFMRAAVTLLGNLPLLKRVMSGWGAPNSAAGPATGQTSRVQGRYLRMTLDHDSGDMDGEVLEGSFKGQVLTQLQLDQLLQLLGECQEDDESVALLEAYLDRTYADTWRQEAGAQEQAREAASSDDLSRAEALEILGLTSDADEDEIIEAHRRLMQKLHPDRGGSAYLAAKINQAKDFLLAGGR